MKCRLFSQKVILVLLVIAMSSCDSSSTKKEMSGYPQEPSYQEPVRYSYPDYSTKQVTTDTAKPVEPAQTTKEVQPQPLTTPSSQPTKVTISRYYEEGYENGYDDGEDDAVMGNGWQNGFDDSNHYKGKKRKDYELGYEEGYEAGYYDNEDGDIDD